MNTPNITKGTPVNTVREDILALYKRKDNRAFAGYQIVALLPWHDPVAVENELSRMVKANEIKNSGKGMVRCYHVTEDIPGKMAKSTRSMRDVYINATP